MWAFISGPFRRPLGEERQFSVSVRKEALRTHSIQAGLSAREGEGEAQRKTSVLHPHVVQEVTDALHNVIEQLEEDKTIS